MANAIVSGVNRTGLDMAPVLKGAMVAYAEAQAALAPDSDGAFEAVHMAYIEEAERIGSVPTGPIAAARPEVLIDKLGERLAFERAGTRLYEAMLLKCGGVDRDHHAVDVTALARIRDDEEMHFHLVHKCIEQLGADATAMTPCADVVGVQGMGLMQVVSDPRTTIAQALGALLTAELTDFAGWELLIELAERTSHPDMATEFSAALLAEQQHLQMVREWLYQSVLQEVK